MNYMFGADPELFLIGWDSENESDLLTPASIFIPQHAKGNVFPLDDYGAVHCDNIMLELNPNPDYSFVKVANNCVRLLETFARWAQHHPEDNVIYLDRYHIFPHVQLSKNDTLITESVYFEEFGCSPDYNAYTRKRNINITLPDTERVAGGHLMISSDDERMRDKQIILSIVKWLDYLLPVITLDPATRVEIGRRKYYGQAGSFRPKKFINGFYGVEYRVPSNYWLRVIWEAYQQGDMPTIVKDIEDAMVQAVESAFAFEQPPIDEIEIQQIINEANMEKLILLAMDEA